MTADTEYVPQPWSLRGQAIGATTTASSRSSIATHLPTHPFLSPSATSQREFVPLYSIALSPSVPDLLHPAEKEKKPKMFARFSRALPRSQLAGPPIRPLYRYTATGLGASMWFWIFYKAKEDGMSFSALPLAPEQCYSQEEQDLSFSAGSTPGITKRLTSSI